MSQKKMVLAMSTVSLFSAVMMANAFPIMAQDAAENGWKEENGVKYWYENGVKQGTEGRGKEIYDPESDAWYWLDAEQGGTVAKSKDVYMDSDAGVYADNADGTGKWVRYDEEGHMIKGWHTTDAGTYYFDLYSGAMAKGTVVIDGTAYNFDTSTGVLTGQFAVDDSFNLNGWNTIDGVEYWFENGVKQGVFGRGKEIYDSDSDAWYWLDSIDGGKMAVSKDVYQESEAGDWAEDKETETGKWVRYDEYGHMIKGWNQQDGNSYYFDPVYGTMAKGIVHIDEKDYEFDKETGVLIGEVNSGDNENKENIKYSGNIGEIVWEITDKGELIMTGTCSSNQPYQYLHQGWTDYKDEIVSARTNISGAINLSGFFEGCSNLKSVDLSQTDMSNVENTGGLFRNCGNLTDINFGTSNAGKVKNMNFMFENCSSLEYVDLSNFKGSPVEQMDFMFSGCTKLKAADLSNLDTSNSITTMAVFSGCSSLTDLQLGNFKMSRSLLTFFSGCSSLTNLDLSGVDTSNVEDMSLMFRDCTSLTELDLSGFDTSNVKLMIAMFRGCTGLTKLNLSSFDTSKAIDMNDMFYDCENLTEILVGSKWVIGEETSASYMFYNCGTDHVDTLE